MPRKKKKAKSRKRFSFRNKWLFISAIIVLIIALIVIVSIILVQFEVIKNPLNFRLAPQEFILKDECSVIAGQLIHTIKNAGTCEMKCKINCDSLEMEFYNYEFTKNPGNCHECKCYCKK